MTRGVVGICAAALLLAGCAPAGPAGGGEPVRIGLSVGDPPQVGRAAPELVLPYATQAGAGPADQPFDLRKELGRVVVIAFCRLDYADECLAQWRTFRDQQDALFGAGVVVAGVSADTAQGLARFAADHQLPFKFLSDPDRQVARRFGFADSRGVRHVMLVVGRDGRVRYIDPAFSTAGQSSYNNLAAAVRAAKET